jgi:uncharacterized OB-fold protein
MAADSMVTAGVAPKPGHKAIRVGPDGAALIEGLRCPECGAVLAEATMACRACGSRQPMEPFRAAQTGTLYSWAVIHRSYPGIAVPFVSAIVDLDGGPTLKGTLRGVDVDALQVGMSVRLIFDDAGGARDKQDVPYVGFHFIAGESQ